MSDKDEPITFLEPAYAIFDVGANAVRTTPYGNLAIFSTKGMAERWAASSAHNLKVIEVMISRVH